MSRFTASLHPRDGNGRFSRSGRSARKSAKIQRKIVHYRQVVAQDSRVAKGPISEIYRRGYPSRKEFAGSINVTRGTLARLEAKHSKIALKGKKVKR